MLSAADRLLRRPRRVLVAGVSGAGKTTLARRLSARLGLPYTELDGLFHGPQWTPRPQFLDDVRALAGRDAWVTEWQYDAARPLLVARAEVLVWLDLPFPLVLLRVVRRTIARRLRREVLWNGNREGPLWTFLTDPEHVVRWSVSTRRKLDRLVPDVAERLPELTVVRLRSRRDVEAWLVRLP